MGKLKGLKRRNWTVSFRKNVLTGAKEFWRCADCGKIYLEGRHWENIRNMIEEVRSDV